MMNYRKFLAVGAGTVFVCALLAACVSMSPRANPDYDASKPHHRPGSTDVPIPFET